MLTRAEKLDYTHSEFTALFVSFQYTPAYKLQASLVKTR